MIKKIIAASYRIPKLLYVPYCWSEQEKAEWLAMPHFGRQMTRRISVGSSDTDRLLLLNARGGAVMPEQTVMPIDLKYDAEERVRCLL